MFWDRPATATHIIVQPRDLEILRAVFRHRFARPEHARLLLAAESLRTVRRRMRVLWENRYLARPRSQRPTKALTEEIVYGLAKGGAVLLERGDPKRGIAGDPTVRIAQLDWDETPDKQPGWLFMDHQLLVTDVMAALAVASRRVGLALQWKGHHYRKEDIISYRNRRNELCQIIPDAHFALVLPGQWAVYYFLEADRGRPLARMKEKYEAYFEWSKLLQRRTAASDHPHRRPRFPFVKFRILTVATDARHRDALRRAAADVGRNREHRSPWRALFFAHRGEFDLEHPELILEAIFYYAGERKHDEEEPVSLLPRQWSRTTSQERREGVTIPSPPLPCREPFNGGSEHKPLGEPGSG